uniref:Uncharacterized protein n=1 Tax=Romanomermis culicivorax TaxID=13658 RepID=A0A915J0W4_ROMCU
MLAPAQTRSRGRKSSNDFLASINPIRKLRASSFLIPNHAAFILQQQGKMNSERFILPSSFLPPNQSQPPLTTMLMRSRSRRRQSKRRDNDNYDKTLKKRSSATPSGRRDR